MTSIYESGAYLEQNPTWDIEDSPWKARQVTKALRAASITPATLCDIGCGVGQVIRELRRDYPTCRFTGYDLSPQAITKAKQLDDDKSAVFEVSDWSTINGHFDVALALDVFEHIEDYYGFLRKIKTIADVKVFHVPLDWTVRSTLSWESIQQTYNKVGHLHFFTKDTAMATFNHCGYEVLHWFYTPSYFDMPKPGIGYSINRAILKLACSINVDLAERVLGGHQLMVLAR